MLLNDKWDICVDSSGNIAVTTGAYAIAQNAANAIRLFTNDAYFNRTKGIPHFDVELGKKPIASQSMLINRIRKACLAVEGVTGCEPVLEYKSDGRLISGDVYLTIEDGTTVRISL